VFADLTNQSGLTLVLALCLYSFQIYYDFYGYTQIAIGLARCFGVKLSINFNNPYSATSVQDFWHRWHITLSSWFRDYVYIPFGGKSLAGPNFGAVILLVFLLSGLWHGASLNFLLWGLIHAFLYLAGRMTRPARDSMAKVIFRGSFGDAVRKIGGRIFVFCMISFVWLFFRVESLPEIVVGLKKLALLDTSVPFAHLGNVYSSSTTIVFVGILALAYGLHVSGVVSRAVETVPMTIPQIVRELALVNSFVIPLLLVGDIGTRDFIYFRF
jgi:D-alanyl-lipoteichoic acid acyltransferase DltB (MBOAT superfamily)